MRGELPTKAARTTVAQSPFRTACSGLVTAVLDPELQTIIAICIIGILVTLDMALRFPAYGALIVELNSFP
jgi:hypothetical protein